MTEPIKPLRIFLSYIKADIVAARELYRSLRSKGFEVWSDEKDLAPGQNWQREIVKELHEADAIIVCFSQSVVNKDGVVQKEFKFALEQALLLSQNKENACLIPVRFQECSTPTQLSECTWVDLFERGGFESLMRGLRRRANDLGRAAVRESNPGKKTLPPVEDSSTTVDGNAQGNIVIKGDHNNIFYPYRPPLTDTEKIEKDHRDVLQKQAQEQAEAEAREKQRLKEISDEQIKAQAREKARLEEQLIREQADAKEKIRLKELADEQAREKARLEEQIIREQADAKEKIRLKKLADEQVREKARLEQIGQKSREKSKSARETHQGGQQTKNLIGWGGTLIGGLVCLVLFFLSAAIIYNVAILPTQATPSREVPDTPKPTATFMLRSTSTEPPVAAFTTTPSSPTATTAGSTPVANVTFSQKDGMKLLLVSAGPFLMGDDKAGSSEKPAHTVILDDYWIDETEVTNQMYAACVADGACKKPYNFTSPTRPDYYTNEEYADYPITHVFWKDAKNYCQWAGRVLPSEAQWEKAARGDETKKYPYPWGHAAPTTISTLLNYNNPQGDTNKVGSYPEGKSPYGALDMAGNVWEWVNDYFDHKYYSISPLTNPQGPSNGDSYGMRGGSWNTARASVRTFYRANALSGHISVDVGFRCAWVP